MDVQLQQEIKEKVKRKFKSENLEEEINDSIEEAESLILNYCHIVEIPIGLKITIVNMVCDLIRHDILNSKYLNEKNVKSINRGDTAITYEDSEEIKGKDEIMASYSKELNGYRKLSR